MNWTPSTGSGSRPFDRGRLAFVVVVAVIALVLDATVLPMVGVGSVAEAIQRFVVVVVGAYGGLMRFDVSWGVFFSET